MWIARFEKMITVVFTCFQGHENCLGDGVRFTKYRERIDYVGFCSVRQRGIYIFGGPCVKFYVWNTTWHKICLLE